MNRSELIELITKIKRSAEIEAEADEDIEYLRRNVSDPQVTDYIFFEELTPEEIVDRILNYKPIQQ